MVKIMAKRKLILTLLACLLLFYVFYYKNPKVVATNYILKNHKELETFVEKMIYNSSSNVISVYNEWGVYYWAQSKMVEFMVGSYGIVSASSYEGFYYSPDDKPLCFQGAKVKLIEEGSGWRWEGGGDNKGYTEKIMDKWYWFTASF